MRSVDGEDAAKATSTSAQVEEGIQMQSADASANNAAESEEVKMQSSNTNSSSSAEVAPQQMQPVDAKPTDASEGTTSSPPATLVTIEGTSIPVLIFLNSGSGGRQGGKLLKKFQQWVGDAQVYDLANVRKGGPKPEDVLARYVGVEGLRVIACGGDGTCCWIFSALAKVSQCKAMLGTMPLGTGNDFSRALG